ncbi:MAG: type I restriction enzyme HsdR N-terminal domain-containing protein [Campylobacterales bacterium]|nr:type I restriction enzyme HsdR N-terminal domain-containing protein [Campylobacterales bacterium]
MSVDISACEYFSLALLPLTHKITQEFHMPIFQQSILKNYTQDENLIAPRWAAYQNFLAKKEAIKDFKEEEYQEGFLKDIFEACLGYTLKTANPQNYNLERETKNENDGKKADGAIYVDGKVTGVIELKDQKTKNLDKASDQAFGYLNKNSHAKYVIVSNFNELRFYVEKATAYEQFFLFELDYDGFKKLHTILSF